MKAKVKREGTKRRDEANEVIKIKNIKNVKRESENIKIKMNIKFKCQKSKFKQETTIQTTTCPGTTLKLPMVPTILSTINLSFPSSSPDC